MRTLNRNDERYQESRSDATRSKRSSVSRPQSLGRYSVASERSDPSLPPTQTTATVVPIEEAVAVSTVFALFSPNDTIRQTFTKAILVGLTVVTGAFGIVSLVVWSAVIGGGTCSDCLGYYVAAIAPLVIMIMTSGVLLYARSVRQVPDACMDVVFVGAAINICATAIAVPSFPGTYFCLATSILVALCKTPRILFHALILSVVWWICAVNEVYLAFTGGTPASLFLPRSIPPTQVSGFIYYAVAYLVSGALVYTISIVLNMYERNQQISDNTRDMCIKVHGFLHTYATDDARAAITPYAHANEQKARSEHSDAGPDDHLVVDHDILTALSEMVDRIERFRTHLPNWVIRTDPNSSPADPGSELPSGVSTPSHRAGPTLSKTSSSVGRYSGHAFKPLQPAFFGKVSYCALDFGFDSTRIFATSGDPEHIVALFVERVHVHVETTQGSLHSFVGDQVVASFNATSRCTNHELAAVSFAMRVRGDPGSQFVFSSGYVTTTDARTQLTGSAGSAAFLVSLKTKSLPTTLQLISREAQSLVIDAVTNIAAKNTFETRAIDAVWVTDNSSSAWRLQPQSIERVASMSAFLDSTDFEISLHGSTAPPTSSAGVLRPGAHTQLAYQVVKDRQARMNQQNEWIYVVDRTPGEVVNRDVTNATVKCVDGLYEDALAILSKLPLDVRNDPAVSRLAKAAQWCSDKNVPQGYFARRVPHATTSKPAAESSSSPTMQQTSEPEITRSAPLQLVFGGGANP